MYALAALTVSRTFGASACTSTPRHPRVHGWPRATSSCRRSGASGSGTAAAVERVPVEHPLSVKSKTVSRHRPSRRSGSRSQLELTLHVGVGVVEHPDAASPAPVYRRARPSRIGGRVEALERGDRQPCGVGGNEELRELARARGDEQLLRLTPASTGAFTSARSRRRRRWRSRRRHRGDRAVQARPPPVATTSPAMIAGSTPPAVVTARAGERGGDHVGGEGGWRRGSRARRRRASGRPRRSR